MPYMHVSMHDIIIPIYFDFLAHLLLLLLRMPAFNAGVVSRNIGAKEAVSVLKELHLVYIVVARWCCDIS